MNRPKRSFWDVVEALRGRSPEYRREAYGFVLAALGATVQALPESRRADPERRHLSGGELIDGVLRLGRQEFGSMADLVFREWGMTRGEDVGQIVFRLVEFGQLSARPSDTMADFAPAGDLLAALRAAGRQPPGRRPAPRRGAEGGATAEG